MSGFAIGSFNSSAIKPTQAGNIILREEEQIKKDLMWLFYGIETALLQIDRFGGDDKTTKTDALVATVNSSFSSLLDLLGVDSKEQQKFVLKEGLSFEELRNKLSKTLKFLLKMLAQKSNSFRPFAPLVRVEGTNFNEYKTLLGRISEEISKAEYSIRELTKELQSITTGRVALNKPSTQIAFSLQTSYHSCTDTNPEGCGNSELDTHFGYGNFVFGLSVYDSLPFESYATGGSLKPQDLTFGGYVGAQGVRSDFPWSVVGGVVNLDTLETNMNGKDLKNWPIFYGEKPDLQKGGYFQLGLLGEFGGLLSLDGVAFYKDGTLDSNVGLGLDFNKEWSKLSVDFKLSGGVAFSNTTFADGEGGWSLVAIYNGVGLGAMARESFNSGGKSGVEIKIGGMSIGYESNSSKIFTGGGNLFGELALRRKNIIFSAQGFLNTSNLSRFGANASVTFKF